MDNEKAQLDSVNEILGNELISKKFNPKNDIKIMDAFSLCCHKKKIS